MACHLRDFEDKILIHQFLKSESTKGLCMYPCMVNSDKQERSRIVQMLSIKISLTLHTLTLNKIHYVDYGLL